MSEPTRPTCATCAYYDPDAPTLEYPNRPAAYTIPYPVTVHGLCRRGHQGQPHRKPDEWCGEHQDFPAYLAALKPAPDPPPGELAESIRELNLSVRAMNILEAEGIGTIGDLIAKPLWAVENLRGFGPTCLYDLRRALAGRNLKLKNDPWRPMV